MKKKDIIKALVSFTDEDELTMGDSPFIDSSRLICGKTQYAMVYKCVLKPGHTGECYCGCKGLYFIPDSDSIPMCDKDVSGDK
jgi:hypothetical protein